MGNLPIGAMITRGETHGRMTDAIASVGGNYLRSLPCLRQRKPDGERAARAEQLRTTVLDSLATRTRHP